MILGTDGKPLITKQAAEEQVKNQYQPAFLSLGYAFVKKQKIDVPNKQPEIVKTFAIHAPTSIIAALTQNREQFEAVMNSYFVVAYVNMIKNESENSLTEENFDRTAKEMLESYDILPSGQQPQPFDVVLELDMSMFGKPNQEIKNVSEAFGDTKWLI